jgi:hypothetical protein
MMSSPRAGVPIAKVAAFGTTVWLSNGALRNVDEAERASFLVLRTYNQLLRIAGPIAR